MPYLLPLLVIINSSASAPVPTHVDATPLTLAGGTIDHRLYPSPAAHVLPHQAFNSAPQEDRITGRLSRGAIGGLIGGVIGVATCTLISNAFFNEGGGVSTCTAKGNLMFGGGGFVLGFAIGWLTGGR
jgi:hypothetical protein